MTIYWRRYRNKNTDDIHADVITNALIEKYYKMEYLTEVKFDGFTVDLMLLSPARNFIAGIEVKSPVDTLNRLRKQLRGYLKYFHKVFVATTFKQLKGVMKVVTEDEFKNVGVLVYDDNEKGFYIQKEALRNDVKGVRADWISDRHQLKQWNYLLERIWG